MKTLIVLLGLMLAASQANAEWVNGYTRRDGSYVQSHQRTAPDSQRGNNYGSGVGPGYSRDSDRDGIPNYRDRDDNNDGRSDDFRKFKY